ncbi:MAG: hypothetical protein A3H28_14510 [Acidobacteria bacterium RIFCSPLOWO2_02_FULL_61_28]|nr:MAG: hypothetical protein A3H28_14510 [Acidobacteria bacterium RIFCSPLOWO2_02_FULL_61_28]
MESALIGLVGVLIGALLSEHFRRRNRVEVYSHKIFERRLEVYEGLMALVQQAYTIAVDVMENSKRTPEERHTLIAEAVHLVADYTDNNALFIDGYVGSHATAMFMGAEDVQSISDDVERNVAISEFQSMYKSAKQMILEESGVHEINKHFKLVSRSNPESPIINRIKWLEKNNDPTRR